MTTPIDMEALLRAMDQARQDSHRPECPSSELLVQFTLEELQPEQRDEVVAHLGGCGHCARESLALLDSQDEEAKAPPQPEFVPPGYQPQARIIPLFPRVMTVASSFVVGAIAACLGLIFLVPQGLWMPRGRGAGSLGQAKRPGEICQSNQDCTTGVCETTRQGDALVKVCRLTQGEPCSKEVHALGICANGLVCAEAQGALTCMPGECFDDRGCPKARPRCVQYACEKERAP